MLLQNKGYGSSRGGEVTGGVLLLMADWTAEGGALGTETRGRNKCYWTGLHTVS